MRRNVNIRRLLPVVLAIGLWAGANPAAAASLTGFPLIQQDGSLRLNGRTVHLFGIYIPPTNRQCRTFIRPAKCASRAVLQLDLQLRGFARCETVRRNTDASVDSVCRIKGTDLAAWMLAHGWAVARPEAPFEYVTLERIARAQERGIWGFSVDAITRR